MRSIRLSRLVSSHHHRFQRQQQQRQQRQQRQQFNYYLSSSCYCNGENDFVVKNSLQQQRNNNGRLSLLLQRRSLLRNFSSSSCINDTALRDAGYNNLLKGLDVHTVPSEMDDHPLAVYSIQHQQQQQQQEDKDGSSSSSSSSNSNATRTPVLLLHGRTWSSVPVYHLIGDKEHNDNGNNNDNDNNDEDNNFSLMEALYNTGYIQPYTMDFRGFGGTPKDKDGYVEPLKCVRDVISVLKWIHQTENEVEGKGVDVETTTSPPPALLGWSHGALIAQIVAQRHPEHLSKLILYSSIYNPNIKYSIPPPYEDSIEKKQRQSSSSQSSSQSSARLLGHTDHDDFPLHEMTAPNEYDYAMADFTNYFDTFKPAYTSSSSAGTTGQQYQPPKSAKLFANAALISDPIKAQWWNLHQLNECHPSQVTSTPTMVIVGDNDPYSPSILQAELFCNLGSVGVDRVWSIIANADHAVHLSEERGRFVKSVGSFLQSK
jgi:pimeloyl-ACP methyl ester carboxylesterase